jgi:hypothetical protein
MSKSLSLSLSFLIKQFTINTMIGQESGLYKSLSSDETRKKLLSTNGIKAVFPEFIINYLNGCYKSLILKDDKYVTEKFTEMKSVHNHSEICLLNIIAFLISFVHNKIDRAKFNIESYDKYIISATEEITKILDEVDLETKLNHQCNGMDIGKCDPNKPMFYNKLSE